MPEPHTDTNPDPRQPPQRPVAPTPIDPRTIPALAKLIPLPRWCVWRYVWRPGNGTKPGKWTKPPYQITSIAAASDNDATWNSFAAVWAAVQDPKFDGIGFMLKGLPRLAVLDLDNVREPVTGALVPWAETLVRAANSYTEITPSYCGLRVIGLAFDYMSIHRGSTKHPSGQGAYEIYVNATRYITVTGRQLQLPEVS
jgi:primase-polymerase (primpol)-like protein